FHNAAQSYHYNIAVNYEPEPTAALHRTRPPQPFDFTISPNPAHDDVAISIPNEGRSTVEIYDVLGNLILRRDAVVEAMIWNCAHQMNGSYIVRVSNNDGTIVSRSKRLLL